MQDPSWTNEFWCAAISIKAFPCLIPVARQDRKGHETSGADWKTKKTADLGGSAVVIAIRESD
jgi:hypothetical protein